jgi:hypothetical protein
VNERSGLARRRMLSTLVPQTLESPLFFHLSGGGGPGGSAQFDAAVEQVEQAGFDMIIYSFGSGFDWEVGSCCPSFLVTNDDLPIQAREKCKKTSNRHGWVFRFTHFHQQSTDESYIADIANRTQYAKSKGIEVAGYDLIAWTRRPPNPGWIATDPINPSGVSACMASGWYDWLTARVNEMIDKTGEKTNGFFSSVFFQLPSSFFSWKKRSI